ncbi:GNAT family N-acetyltransferase [Gorillibacterium sp. CAU 1737]|uniref:GNAT family N-acetyltransferase n=1 Tax=Gorillibacterium sp. CAU 1737 TaxID=3140362 RepID=UPI003260B58E
MEIAFHTNKNLPQAALKKVYNDVQWTAYTRDLPMLQKALLQSLDVISAWDQEELVGLIRVVGDGVTIVYIQDLLVRTDYQNRGIATRLMEQALARYEKVRQKVLLTEEAPDVRHFYEKHGFQSCDQGTLVAFAKLE